MGKLDGKVAIVTGAARGLGRGYAKRLAGLGAKVAVTDLNLRSYEEFEAEAKAIDRPPAQWSTPSYGFLLFFTALLLPSGSHTTGKLAFKPEEKNGKTSDRR